MKRAGCTLLNALSIVILCASTVRYVYAEGLTGEVTAHGDYYYNDRNNNIVPARFMKLYLYDDDPGGIDDLLSTTTSNVYGYSSFPSRMNFDPIGDIVFQSTTETTLSGFWNSWKTSGQNKHQVVQTIYQNTIDYDTAPEFTPLFPDLYLIKNRSYPHIIDLWSYAADSESADAELSFRLTDISDSRCGLKNQSNLANR